MFYDYLIDASDIWHYEFYHRLNERSDNAHMIEILSLMENIFIQKGQQPILRKQDVDENLTFKEEYEKALEAYRIKAEIKYCISNFCHNQDIYSLSNPCPVDNSNIDSLTFERLFALKMRQYQDALSLTSSFLKYQLERTFKNDLIVFKHHLRFVLMQHKSYFSEDLVAVVNEWIASEKSNPVETSNSVLPEESQSQNEQLEESLTELTNTDISVKELEEKLQHPGSPPTDYEVIDGKFTKPEIEQFFAFLYKEKDSYGTPFLTQDDCKDIFKFGVAIPSEANRKKYKLNVNKGRPKSMVEYCIHQFIQLYDRRMKIKVLSFFASYIEDFSGALESEWAMQLWAKNVTGKKPHRMSFDYIRYVPYRFNEQAEKLRKREKN